MVKSEEQQNEELISLSKQILDLTKAIHALTRAHTEASAPSAGSSPK
jgi:hypothetical protein